MQVYQFRPKSSGSATTAGFLKILCETSFSADYTDPWYMRLPALDLVLTQTHAPFLLRLACTSVSCRSSEASCVLVHRTNLVVDGSDPSLTRLIAVVPFFDMDVRMTMQKSSKW